MAYTLLISAEAQQEETDAYNYYEGIRPGLGDDLLIVLEKSYNKIRENPFYFSYVGTSTLLRDVKIERFPFVIVYFVMEKRIFVLSVRNTYRRPIV
jgi:hypothetical protein